MNHRTAAILCCALLPAALWPAANRAAAAPPAAANSSRAATPNTDTQIATEYDLVYAITHASVKLAVSPFLTAMVASAGPPPAGATALDIGSGNGRNTLYLARHGYRVTGVDLSRVGLDLTQQTADRDHLPVRTVAADINRFRIGRAHWNLITLIDFPFPYRALLPRIAQGLKPGGMVVIQAVSSRQSGLEAPDHSLRYTFMHWGDLAAPFRGFSILHNTMKPQHTVWGVRALMIRFAARKARAAAPGR